MRLLYAIPILLAASCSQKAAVEVLPAQKGAALGSHPVADVGQAFAAPVALNKEPLARLLQLSPNVFSGAQPHGANAFATLAALGVKTVVCVDSARPDVALAEQAGLRYVHIPIGYDGISEQQGDAFAHLMATVEAPVYFHCHHGKHRGPAAAAIALRAETGCSGEVALEVLKIAGTSHDYPGLWRDVAAWSPPRPGKELPELVAVAKVDDFAAGMAQLDRTWDNVKDLRRAGWQSPEQHPDLSLLHEAEILVQELEGCAGNLSVEQGQDPVLSRGMDEALSFARALQSAAQNRKVDLLEQSYRDLRASCTDCHHDYRNEVSDQAQ